MEGKSKDVAAIVRDAVPNVDEYCPALINICVIVYKVYVYHNCNETKTANYSR